MIFIDIYHGVKFKFPDDLSHAPSLRSVPAATLSSTLPSRTLQLRRPHLCAVYVSELLRAEYLSLFCARLTYRL